MVNGNNYLDVDMAERDLENEQQSSLRVLGISMVVDQRGKGPRMILRYPTTTSCYSEDLFYALPGRQMAKLFRPKPSLCGQPMTLSVGGTVFCCCAVLMDDPNDDQQASDVEDTNNDHLVLFSVIVALAPQERTFSIPIGGWMEAAPTVEVQQAPLDILEGKFGAPTSGKPSATFLCIRRVHVSLARLCRALEREERRCRYVSVQANLCDQIRYDLSQSSQKTYSYQKLDDPQPPSTHNTMDTSSSHTNNNKISSTVGAPAPSQPNALPSITSPSTTTLLSPTLIVSSKTPGQFNVTPPAPAPTRHRRVGSFTVSFERDVVPATKAATPAEINIAAAEEKCRQEELEQEILETMMTAPPTRTSMNDTEIEHQGNLTRELVQVYHALARKDHGFQPTPAILLSGREGVVYVNRHVAVAIEAVSPVQISNTNHIQLPIGLYDDRPVIRPYLTLLFPDASPSQLLKSMMATTASSPSVAPRRLQQLLRMVNPQKTLTDIAADTNLPVHSTLEIAAYLVNQGACLAKPVISHKIRLACHRINKIQESALAFSQTFGSAVNLFSLVSFLTDSCRTLGEVRSLLMTSNDPNIVKIRASLETSLSSYGRGDDHEGAVFNATSSHPIDDYTDETGGGTSDRLLNTDGLEEILYQMVVWLCSHEVLILLQDYLVRKFITINADQSETINGDDLIRTQGDVRYAERKSDSNTRLDSLPDDLLFRELVESDCLTGKVSIQECCWKTGLDPIKLYAFLSRNEQVRLVTRVPTKGDDFGAV